MGSKNVSIIVFVLFVYLSSVWAGEYVLNSDDWVWYDSTGKRRTKAELEDILSNHGEWISSFKEFAREIIDKKDNSVITFIDLCSFLDRPERISDKADSLKNAIFSFSNDPRRARIKYAVIDNVKLIDVDLSGSILKGSSFKDSKLDRVKFVGALMGNICFLNSYLHNVNLEGAEASDADFSGAKLNSSNFKNMRTAGIILNSTHIQYTDFCKASLRGSYLNNAIVYESNLYEMKISQSEVKEAEFQFSNMKNVDLAGSDLRGARFSYSNLSGVDLTGLDLSDTEFYRTDLRSVIFEPDIQPKPHNIAYSIRLDRLKYKKNPTPLLTLRKSLEDAGFRRSAKQVNASLRRSDATLIDTIFLDLTCAYGTNLASPLLIIIIVMLIFAKIYSVALLREGRAGIYIIVSPKTTMNRNINHTHFRKLTSKSLLSCNRKPRNRVDKIALLFSIQSAFKIGYGGFSPYEWLRMLYSRDFVMKAMGWPRILSGVQSLVSIYMIIIVFLSLFGGHFFDY